MSSKFLSKCMIRLIADVVGFSDCNHLDDFVFI